MSDDQSVDERPDLPFYGDHRFFAMILLSICVAFVLVAISLALYSRSGAAQLDLSRPGYKEIRSKVTTKDDTFSNFSNTGAISRTVIDEFRALYAKQSDKARAIEAFSGDPLDPDVLWPASDSDASPILITE